MALQADGWFLRQTIIWHKPGPMPESVTDRCTKAHEYVFLLAKSARYFYDAEAIAEPSAYPSDNRAARRDTRKEIDPFCADNGSRSRTGNPTGATRNRRSVWTVATRPYSGAHFATFPPALITPCILAGTSERGCCPKCGKPWERVVEAHRSKDPARHTGRAAVGCLDRQDADQPRMITESRTTGWRPGCECGGDPVPCTVLDPFGGSGTTGEVAKNMFRKAVLIELNEQYLKLQTERMAQEILAL